MQFEAVMSAGDKAARDAMRESVGDNRAQMELTEESRVLLAGLLRNEMRGAVSDGIADALTNENAERFWAKGLEVLQQQAANRAGLMVLGGLKKLVGVAAVVLAVYMLAGAPAAKAIWVALTKG